MMTDPIADMLTRIRNTQKTGRENVEVPFSKVKKAIADILNREGYIGKVEETAGRPAKLVLELKYKGKEPTIRFIKRESKPGHRVYRKAGELPKVLNGFGIAIVSTSRGLMTDKQAREAGLGGEVICSVY